MVLVPEDRKQQGIVARDSRSQKTLPSQSRRCNAKGGLAESRGPCAEKASGVWASRGDPDTRSASSPAATSRRWCSPSGSPGTPRVFILDEPTRGIDVGARSAIYEVIAELASSGMAVVVVSSDLEEMLGLSHRVMVLARGRSQGLLEGDSSLVPRSSNWRPSDVGHARRRPAPIQWHIHQ